MPNILEVDSNIYDALVESFGKEALNKKVDYILLSGIESSLEKYTKEILKFEEKYGYSFIEFEKMWDNDKINKKHSYEVESDFIDWEMLEMEKKGLLSTLSRLKGVRINE